MYDVDYAVQSTEFDIVEQGEVPTLMPLPQMRNLRFQFDLHPDKAYLSSPVLGIKNMNLKVARSTHLILDLLDVREFMWNVKFERHKKVGCSSLTTSTLSSATTRMKKFLLWTMSGS